MYSKDCCKNTTAICRWYSNSLKSYYVILSSYHDLLASLEGHEFDNITYNIIPFVSIPSTWLLFFLQLSPATSIGILIYL